MTSPDLQPIADLTLYDADPGDMLDAALAAIDTYTPGLTLREGFTEVAILEGQATMNAELTYRVNRLPNALTEGLGNLFALLRDPGAPATTTVTFYVSDALGHTIDAGTALALATGTGDDAQQLVFTTDTPLAIPAGATSRTVAATATTVGTIGNGFPANTPLQLLDSVAYVDVATTGAPTLGGRDVEDDATFYNRVATRAARLSAALVTATQVQQASLEQPYVYRSIAVDKWNGQGPNSPGSDPGHVTLGLLGPDGLPVSSANKTALLALLAPQTHPALNVHLIDVVFALGDVTVQIHLLPGYVAATVQAAVVAALRAYMNPLTWVSTPYLRYNELITLVSNVPGVDYVASMAIGGGGGAQSTADVFVQTSPVQLVKAGTLAVTVV